MAPEPVTEIDGTIAREFFTILNNAQSYTEDQSYNIVIFSSLYSWLHNLYLNESSNLFLLDRNFMETIITYCLRVIEQSKLKPAGQNTHLPIGSTSKPDDSFPDIALQESIRLLDILCSIDSSLVRICLLLLLLFFFTFLI